MEFDNFPELYTEHDKEILKIAEDALNPHLDRVNEIIEYAKEAKIKTIGIANCTTFNKEAVRLEDIFVKAGFQVEKVNCKYGRVPLTNLLRAIKAFRAILQDKQNI